MPSGQFQFSRQFIVAESFAHILSCVLMRSVRLDGKLQLLKVDEGFPVSLCLLWSGNRRRYEFLFHDKPSKERLLIFNEVLL